MSTTPRTDAAERDFYCGRSGVDSDFARILEEENNALRDLLMRCRADMVYGPGEVDDKRHALIREINGLLRR